VKNLLAVDIQLVERITGGDYSAGLRLDRLPEANLEISSVNPSEVAVLSWRWDIDPPTFTSMNVAISIEQAAQMGVKFLFFDLVSIDQTLRGDELIQSVANLAALYSSIPVIAAYDEKNAPQWLKTMRRPWISFEARAYGYNPTHVTYVGYIDGQGTADEFGFRHMLDRIKGSSYTNSILMVLCNQVSMGDLRDLRYMIPDFVNTLTLCHSQMNRADYLLSAAILAQSLEDDIRVNGDIEFLDQDFSRYSFVEAGHPGYDESRDIILAGQKIATWYRGLDRYYALPEYQPRRKLGVEPGAEEMILSSIGAPGKSDVTSAKKAGPRSFKPTADAKKPDIKIVRAQINKSKR
jgi:hypothetical protein